MSCYTELEIAEEAVKVVAKNPGIRTSDLITKLEKVMKPSGDDLEILEGRNDTKFSQKVRNLVSHKSLEDKIIWNGVKNRQWYLK